jgi:hypothetical protein
VTLDEQNGMRDSQSGDADCARPGVPVRCRPPFVAVGRAAPRRAGLRAWWWATVATGLLSMWTLAGSAVAATLPVHGAFHSAVPSIKIVAPYSHGNYGLNARVLARFSCSEKGTNHIATCTGTVANGDPVDTSAPGNQAFTVTATDTGGKTVRKTVHYTILHYTNPLRAVRALRRGRIDQGVDYAGSGPILALGSGEVITATNHDPGWPGGGWLLYQLSQGRFAGKYVYVAENITVHVRAGQAVTAGEQIATLHDAFPDMETGWASDIRDTTLANADGHLCPCRDPGGWSTIEGRNFNNLLVVVGAPSGYLQPHPPKQHMPAGWPKLRRNRPVSATPESRTPLPEGWTARWK